LPEIGLKKISHLFVDVGGVLLSDGWDHHARHRAADHFKLDFNGMEERHRITDGVYEEGRLSLHEYLNRVVFYKEQPFSRAEFRSFMFAQSTPFPEMIALAVRLRANHGLKITVVSNEARELNAHRIRKFKLDRFVDSFVSSCFVHIRKPDEGIYRLALDISQAKPEQVVYLENTAMFIEIAAAMGIRGILHTDYATTRAKLAEFGLEDDAT
jgi:putative hydrolase of the HAD superfamily